MSHPDVTEPPWQEPPRCSVCGQALTGDPDDDDRDPAGPVCGACARARAFDQTLWERDLADPDAGLW